MSKDKYPSIFSPKMEAIVFRPSSFFRLLSNAFSDFVSVGRRKKKKQ